MGEVSTIGVDLAKNVFQVHGADASGAIVFRRKLRRHDVLEFFATQCQTAPHDGHRPTLPDARTVMTALLPS